METVIKRQENLKKKIDIADIHTLETIEDALQLLDNDPLLRMNIEQEAAFLRGIKDADEAKVTPHESVIKKYK